MRQWDWEAGRYDDTNMKAATYLNPFLAEDGTLDEGTVHLVDAAPGVGILVPGPAIVIPDADN